MIIILCYELVGGRGIQCRQSCHDEKVMPYLKYNIQRRSCFGSNWERERVNYDEPEEIHDELVGWVMRHSFLTT